MTTFIIESYKLLQEDPQGVSVALLQQISTQLAAAAESSPTPVVARSSFQPDSRSIRINVLWFSSLVFSLVSASIGILTKQWLREYVSNAASSARESARIRQLRYEGFITWRIPLTIALLPILLQIALALFFIGLLDLLWSLDTVVASVITAFVTISLSFLIFTTIIPTFRRDCPYKSPQALGVFLLYQGFARLMSVMAFKFYSLLGWNRRAWPLYIDPSLFRHRSRRFAEQLRGIIHQKPHRSWKDREKQIARETGTTLDHHMLVGADKTFMDDDLLERVIRACIHDTESPHAVECFHQIATHRADYIHEGTPHWKHSGDINKDVKILLHIVVDILPRMDQGDDAALSKMLNVAAHLCRAIPFETGHDDTVQLYQRLVVDLARLLSRQESVQRYAFDLMMSIWSRSSAPVQPIGKYSWGSIYTVDLTSHILDSYQKSSRLCAQCQVEQRLGNLPTGMRNDTRFLYCVQPTESRLQQHPRRFVHNFRSASTAYRAARCRIARSSSRPECIHPSWTGRTGCFGP